MPLVGVNVNGPKSPVIARSLPDKLISFKNVGQNTRESGALFGDKFLKIREYRIRAAEKQHKRCEKKHPFSSAYQNPEASKQHSESDYSKNAWNIHRQINPQPQKLKVAAQVKKQEVILDSVVREMWVLGRKIVSFCE